MTWFIVQITQTSTSGKGTLSIRDTDLTYEMPIRVLHACYKTVIMCAHSHSIHKHIQSDKPSVINDLDSTTHQVFTRQGFHHRYYAAQTAINTVVGVYQWFYGHFKTTFVHTISFTCETLKSKSSWSHSTIFRTRQYIHLWPPVGSSGGTAMQCTHIHHLHFNRRRNMYTKTMVQF